MWFFFSTQTATERPYLRRRWEMNILRMLPLKWSVQSKLCYWTVGIRKYGSSIWKPAKNGALHRIPKYTDKILYISMTLNWYTWRDAEVIIAIWSATISETSRKITPNLLPNGNISSKSIAGRMPAIAAPSFCSIPINLSKIWSLNTLTLGIIPKERSEKWGPTIV